MRVSSSKENILKKIRKALSHPTPFPFPESEATASVFPVAQDDLEVEFAEQFNKLNGRFIFCLNRQELAFQFNSLLKKQDWKKIYSAEPQLTELIANQMPDRFNNCDLIDCDVSVTSCEYLVARTGTIVMSTAQLSGRLASVYAPIHVCIAFTSQLVFDLSDAIENMKNRYGQEIPSLITFATGPSRTADIEKTLVVGVHGPKEVFCFLVDA